MANCESEVAAVTGSITKSAPTEYVNVCDLPSKLGFIERLSVQSNPNPTLDLFPNHARPDAIEMGDLLNGREIIPLPLDPQFDRPEIVIFKPAGWQNWCLIE